MLIRSLILLAILGYVAFAVYVNRDEFWRLFGLAGSAGFAFIGASLAIAGNDSGDTWLCMLGFWGLFMGCLGAYVARRNMSPEATLREHRRKRRELDEQRASSFSDFGA